MLPTDGQEENHLPKQYNDQDKKFAIWVGNLSQTCTEQEVTEFFGQNCGTVRSIKMLNGRGKQYENSKYCFINFASQHAQEKACEFDEKPLFGSRVTIRKRSEQKKFATLFIGNLHRVSSKEQLKEEFLKLGAPGYEKMELKDGNKYVFVYFKNQHEANMFYDHLQGKSINGVVLAVNFPFSKIERQAINAGVHKDKIHRTKRTVFLGSLSENVTEDDIRDFCKDYGLIEDVKKPKYKRGVAFVEFARKTDADKFVEKFGGKHEQAIAGSGFEAGLARLNTGMAMQEQFPSFGFGRGRGRGMMRGRGSGFYGMGMPGGMPGMGSWGAWGPWAAEAALAGIGPDGWPEPPPTKPVWPSPSRSRLSRGRSARGRGYGAPSAAWSRYGRGAAAGYGYGMSRGRAAAAASYYGAASAPSPYVSYARSRAAAAYSARGRGYGRYGARGRGYGRGASRYGYGRGAAATPYSPF